MKEIVNLENIEVKAIAKDWREAIGIAGRLLLKAGKVKEEYISSMINAVIDMGPYMVLAPGFALAHARPSSDVLENGVSLITLENAVSFGSTNDPVDVILCVACTDSNSHIGVLSAVAEKLMVEGMIGRIAACKSKEEVYSLINE